MGSGKVVKIAAVGVGVVLVGAAGWFVGAGGTGQGEATSSQESTQDLGASVGGASSSGVYEVAYGSRSSSTSPAGVPMGYQQDCTSAVAAAAAYAVAVVGPVITPQGWATEDYTQVLEDVTGASQSSTVQASTDHLLELFAAAPAAASVVTDAAIYPADSLFRVTSCQAGVGAQVDVALVTGATTSGVAFGGVTPISVELVWSGGDWLVQSLDPFATWETWQAMTTAPGDGWTPPAGAAGRALIAVAGGVGWTEFTNAQD